MEPKEEKEKLELSTPELNSVISKGIKQAFGDGDVEIIQLKNRLNNLMASKDKLAQKLTTMTKQVQEVAKAVEQVAGSLEAPINGKTPTAPIRFYRSVGLQVNSETRTQLSVQNTNSMKTKENASPKSPFRNGIVVGPASAKRNAMKAMIGVNDASSTSPNKRTSPIVNRITASDKITDSDMIDLTEEANNKAMNGNAPVVINQGGVQYRLVNQQNSGLGPGMQIINTPSGLQLVNTTQGQARPVLLQNIQPSQNNVVFRQNSNQIRRPPNALQRAPTAVRSVAPNSSNHNRFVNTGQQASVKPRVQPIPFILPPLPPPANSNNTPRKCAKDVPPKPDLVLKTQPDGIVLSWSHPISAEHAEILTYQIFACQEGLSPTKATPIWKRVGDVKALPLPMACTLSQFTDENRYHFIVRGVDVYNRTGPFCDPSSILKLKH